jgi:hypothetical protein
MRRLVVAALLLFPLLAQAADETVLGNKLVVKNPSTPDKRKIVVKAKEVGSADMIVGNPVTSGAILTVTANGATPSSQTYALPTGTSAQTNKPFWSGDAVKGFKYQDAKGENGAVKTAQIERSATGVFQIKATLDGKLGAVAVVPPDPGTDGCVFLVVPGGDSYSAAPLFATTPLANCTL